MTVRSQLTGSTVLHEQDLTTVKPDNNKKKRKRPFLLQYRSNNLFVFFTAAFSLFTSSFVHSILFSLSPFIVASFRNNQLYNATPEENQLNSRETGVLVALYGFGLLAGSPLFGWLGDKIKERRIPLLLGTVASIIANVLFILSINYPMLLVARFLQGLGNACVWTMCLCLIVDNWPREQLGAQMGKLVGFYPMGMVVGLPVGVLYNELGRQAPFVLSMILCTLDFFFRLLLVERSSSPSEWFSKTSSDLEKASPNHINKNHHNRINSTNSGDEGLYDASSDISIEEVYEDGIDVMDVHDDNIRVTWKRLLKQPRLLVSLVVTIMVTTVMTAFEPTLSIQLAQEWNFNPAECSLMILAYLIPCITASGVCGWLCDIYGTKIVGLLSLLMAIPFCILIPLSPNYCLVPVLIMGGVTLAGCQAPVFPEIVKVVDKENETTTGSLVAVDGLAKSYSLFNAAYGIGMCIGPLMAGYLYASIGFLWLCVILSILPLICIPCVYLFMGDNRQLIFKKNNSIEPAIEDIEDEEIYDDDNEIIKKENHEHHL